MERLVITIRPSSGDDGLLRVSDAMQQVIDLLRVYEEAERASMSAGEAFDWRLERASTNSPFTIVARAEPRDRTRNVDAYVRELKGEVASSIRNLVYHNDPAPWMGPEVLDAARHVFTRTQNGIGVTEVESGPGDTFTIGRPQADAGLRAIGTMTAINADAELSERRAWGEIQGVMLAAGRYGNKPAIQIRTGQYGIIWCTLSAPLIERYGGAHRLTEVWTGKSIGVEGTLVYARGGKLSRIEATDIRDIAHAPPVELSSVLDPDFTAGADPVEYVRQLWEGFLAS